MIRIKQIIVLAEAVTDIEAAKVFYENQGCDLGAYFVDSILSDIDSLVITAGVHERHFGFYRTLSKHFPFAVYYDIADEIAIVVAVLDMRIQPGTIQKRINNRDRRV
ncbi:hypothetical protein SMSP2_01617 [Limihaloglobus sulfuriphilus]|uniref:Plasmid stabilization system protein n=1 Tax=Limihaloglobus sulfuriphilus TaxID=1851148 RepID=A0A1Q2MEX3_9BACT|nr:hypothetical protein [Limihaloglobus sulfuriphilus]AQQ71251.1 hypothetical protein SMSP2_01617 [Limihaloglobus sulfuriphilus]